MSLMTIKVTEIIGNTKIEPTFTSDQRHHSEELSLVFLPGSVFSLLSNV